MKPKRWPRSSSAPGANIAQDAPRDQPGDLHAGHVVAVARAQPERVALVLERGLVERRVDEGAGEVPALLHRAVDRRAVRVHVEHVHEHADLERVALQVRVLRPAHLDHAAVGGRQHRARVVGHLARRIAEELQDEERRRARTAPTTTSPAGKPTSRETPTAISEEKPPFPGDDRMGVAPRHDC